MSAEPLALDLDALVLEEAELELELEALPESEREPRVYAPVSVHGARQEHVVQNRHPARELTVDDARAELLRRLGDGEAAARRARGHALRVGVHAPRPGDRERASRALRGARGVIVVRVWLVRIGREG